VLLEYAAWIRPVGRLSTPDGIQDDVLLLHFRGPHSYTGEDVVEFHLHGNDVIVQSVARALTLLGARPAQPGEFTMRAFLAGRIDLTQAEAVLGVIDAHSQWYLGPQFRDFVAYLLLFVLLAARPPWMNTRSAY
jgi:tRNA U34 5-carboxymethylaminomethyl modifying GTPase MnmE/TrmE